MTHRLRLTSRQVAQVKRIQAALLVEIEKAGVRIERKRLPKASSAEAMYIPERQVIIVSRTQTPWSPLPARLDRLFTLAHEFGHHHSHESHKRVGRCLDYDYGPDMLYEESRAWDEAWRLLYKLKMRSRVLCTAFFTSWGLSLVTNVADYQQHWWLAERLTRTKIRCPKCSSRALTVIGADSHKSCAIQCRRCGAHTKPSASMDALDRKITRKRFRNLCPCRKKDAHLGKSKAA